jgi:hypothetical protein
MPGPGTVCAAKDRSNVKHASNVVEQKCKRCCGLGHRIIGLVTALRGKLCRRLAERTGNAYLTRKAEFTAWADYDAIGSGHVDFFLDCNDGTLLGRE